MKKSNQQGFTLIELIIVIVILGILAVTASPKFLDIQSDARASTLEGLEASLKGAINITYSKGLIQGVDSSDSDDALTSPNTVTMVYGYPAAEVLDLIVDATDWQFVEGSTITRIYPSGDTVATVSGDAFSEASDPDSKVCYLQYTEAASDGAEPTIADLSTTTTGC